MIHQETLSYTAENEIYHPYLAHPHSSDPMPALLIAPDWTGCHDFAKTKATVFAEKGYFALALDVYGQGRIGHSTEEKMALMQPLMHDRALLLRRLKAAFSYVKNHNLVDPKRIYAIGFCFGGLCVLDLARSGVELKGVASFHGLLSSPSATPHLETKIKAKILACHGYDDPMVTPADVLAFQKEMTEAKADWQMHIFGQTQHAFTNPQAHDHQLGTVYNPQAEQRSFEILDNFLKEN